MANGDEDQGESGEAPGFKSLPIESSCFAYMAYNSSTEQLQMTFAKDGRSYIIEGIPAIEVDRWINSGSPGGYFNSFVRGVY